MILRVIKSEKERVRSPYIREADDGATAIDEIQQEVSTGGFFDFILMDYVMVRPISRFIILIHIENLSTGL